jgi:hypothetical protein
MHPIVLQPDGVLRADLHPVPVDAVLRCLARNVLLDEGCRLRSVLSMLERYPQLAELSDFAPVLLERYRSAPADAGPWPTLAWLELGKTVEMIGFPGKPRLEIYSTLHGWEGGQRSEIRAIQVEQLLDTPLRLGKLRHVVFGDRVDVFEFDTVFTLFELVDGVTWQLSFHGSPAQCALRR